MTVAVAAPDFQMWVTFAIIVGALALYASARVTEEITSLGVIGVFMVFFHFFPVTGEDGENMLGADRVLSGFSNAALITVLALLVIGQGMVRTGVLDRGAQYVFSMGGGHKWFTVFVTLVVVLLVSGFLNNIPVVVIFIPIMEAVAGRFSISPSKVMMPLSFAAVLGGMTTLIGSGTNLLVSGALKELGEEPLSFFQFTIPGLVMAGAGLIFVFFVVPRLLTDRSSISSRLIEGEGRQFIAQITVSEESELVGLSSAGGLFGAFPEMTLRMIQRDEQAILPPFEELVIQPGDVLVVAATRAALTEAISHDPGLLVPDLGDGREDGEEQRWQSGERVLAEVMVAPASRMAGSTLRQIGFRHQTHCVVLALQRRARMLRRPVTEIRLEEGDVLLIQGRPEDIAELRSNHNVVLLEWSQAELPALDHARRALVIFLAVVGLAASGVVPIVVAAVGGAVAMVAAGALNIVPATRALDTKIFTMIPAALAMGLAMQETGGAAFLAQTLIGVLQGAGVPVLLSAFFLLIALLSNVISAKAAAVLFTPIAVGIAHELGVSIEAFAVAVVFASNCAVATPIGYQTSLLVMGPGHYTFADFARAGLPLVFVLWLVYSLFAPWYYGL
jgi:di/tricarboxylate transporter